MDDFSDLKRNLKTFEGCVSHMYLDTNGFVTVGVGHMIGCCGDAERLSFVLRPGSAAATVDQIAKDFNKSAHSKRVSSLRITSGSLP